MNKEIEVLQMPAFRKVYKKLHKNELVDVNNAIDEIIKNPLIGEEKRGDLEGVFVYKFDCVKKLFLLAYEFDIKSRTLLMLGVHENFYRDMKKGRK